MRRAVILAGGLGSRLRPYTAVLPKPLMPLGRESIIERLVRDLSRRGISDITISLGYLGHLVEAVVSASAPASVRISYTREPAPLGTAGALALVTDRQPTDTFVVVNGDTLTTLAFDAVTEEFERSGADALVVCARRTVVLDFGIPEIDSDGRLVGYQEKPSLHYVLATGINLLRGSALDLLPPARIDMPDFLRLLADSGRDVRCHVTDAIWLDLGRESDLREANELLRENDDQEPGLDPQMYSHWRDNA